MSEYGLACRWIDVELQRQPLRPGETYDGLFLGIKMMREHGRSFHSSFCARLDDRDEAYYADLWG